jgi:hypothetical protein
VQEQIVMVNTRWTLPNACREKLSVPPLVKEQLSAFNMVMHSLTFPLRWLRCWG